MSASAMFYNAVSRPRFSRYLKACNNSSYWASILYRANIKLSKEIYGVIGMFETSLRNSIDNHLRIFRGSSWLVDAVSPGGYLTRKGCEHSYNSVADAVRSFGSACTHDRLVARLPFGFWTYHFAPKQYAAAGNTLLKVFPDRPLGTDQNEIFKDLVRINKIRNRIAHYEPICFEAEQISTIYVAHRYNLIINLFRWMSYEPQKLLFGIDQVTKVIALINNLAQRNNSNNRYL